MSEAANDWVGESSIRHGMLTIGPAVLIVASHTQLNADAITLDVTPFGAVYLNHGKARGQQYIDHQFGGQDITPGRWAHPIIEARPT